MVAAALCDTCFVVLVPLGLHAALGLWSQVVTRVVTGVCLWSFVVHHLQRETTSVSK